MDRRELLKMIALATGSALIGCNKISDKSNTGSPGTSVRGAVNPTISLLDEVGDTIIPETSTPGAKATQIGQFMTIMVRDCYTEEQQVVFAKGVEQLAGDCQKKYNKPFIACSKEQRLEFLTDLEKEAKEHNSRKKPEVPEHYYTMIKQLTIFGYFTSEIGATKALRNVPIPGRYDGAFPYEKGDRAFNDDV